MTPGGPWEVGISGTAEIDQLLADVRITVTEEADDWLMTMVRPCRTPTGPYRVRVPKDIIPADRIAAYARITFANLLRTFEPR